MGSISADVNGGKVFQIEWLTIRKKKKPVSHKLCYVISKEWNFAKVASKNGEAIGDEPG